MSSSDREALPGVRSVCPTCGQVVRSSHSTLEQVLLSVRYQLGVDWIRCRTCRQSWRLGTGGAIGGRLLVRLNDHHRLHSIGRGVWQQQMLAKPYGVLSPAEREQLADLVLERGLKLAWLVPGERSRTGWAKQASGPRAAATNGTSRPASRTTSS